MLELKNISKQYRIGNGHKESLYALNEINFKAERGEIIGILGRNGSGKSTLLKVISGLVSPTDGSVTYAGKISSLLEIGGGIHPELSGKENYLLKGQLLGLTKEELVRNFDQLLEFTELDRFIDEPVKNYSNGMYMRLALGIGLTVKADIYLFDEVLSVGDIGFQKKCLNTVRKLSEEGATVLIVSHNLNELDAYCSRFLLLKNGRLVADSLDRAILSDYISESFGEEESAAGPLFHNSVLELSKLEIVSLDGSDQELENLQPIQLNLDIKALEPIKPFNLTIHVQDHMGVPIFSIGTAYDPVFVQEKVEGTTTYSTTIPAAFLNPDFYSVSLYIHAFDEVLQLRNIKGFQVMKSSEDLDLKYFKGKIRTNLTLRKL